MAERPPRKTDIPHHHVKALESRLRYFLGRWGLEGYAVEIEMKVSSRMTRSIGSANPAKNRITFAVWLFDQPQEIVDEVLCHEAAHLVVHRLNGQRLRPHGREWQSLMRSAGVTPRVRIPLPHPPPIRVRRRGKRRRARPRTLRISFAALAGLFRTGG